jgi:hypothetical protein
LVTGIDKHSMRTALPNQSLLLFSILFDRVFPFHPFLQHSTLWVMVECAPATALDPIVFREEFLEIRPGLRVQFFDLIINPSWH